MKDKNVKIALISAAAVIVAATITATSGLLSSTKSSDKQKPDLASQQNTNVSSSGITGVSNGGNVNINVGQSNNERSVGKQPAMLQGEVDYRDLASPSSREQYIGDKVIFRAMFIGEWNISQIYDMYGIKTSNSIMINHRNVYYSTSFNPLGSSDSEIPPFALLLDKSQTANLRKINPGDTILIHGYVGKPQTPENQSTHIPDFARIYVQATDIQKLTLQP